MNITKVGNYFTWTFLLMMSLFCKTTHATEKKSLKIIESAEKIEFLSQQIIKSYFYDKQNIKRAQAQLLIKDGLNALDSEISALTSNLNAIPGSEEGNMLVFLSFTRDELKESLNNPYSATNGALALDYSESLLEGAKSISKKYTHKDDAKQASIITIDKMAFLLERMSKYYIAFKSGFNDYNNVIQLQNAITNFEKKLAEINQFKGYTKGLKLTLREINTYWPIAKKYYNSIESGTSPRLVYASTHHLEQKLRKIERFHHKQILKE